MIIGIHLLLALGLFFLINWIGRHSHSLGYISLGIFVQRDEAPAFNLALRLLGPLVFLTIVAALLYSARLDDYVQDIWHVSVYYFIGRATFNVLMGRFLLINWFREAVIGGVCISGSWVLYDAVIRHKETLLPDLTTATNELWVIVGVFVYAVLNKVDTGTTGAAARKQRFLKKRFFDLKEKYATTIKESFPDDLSQLLGMTILLYESFNRPWLAQKLEHMVFPYWGRSLGPMQVTTKKRINDMESVRLGFERVVSSYRNWLEETKQSKPDLYEDNYWLRGHLARKVAADYNKDDRYAADIDELSRIITKLFYPELLKND
ncbi:hypothetical protein [Rhodoferax sp. BAB1]|uniref:hypothetical protein n=1 Tax=Rhodoferax sp. BAB1 TaxID=2741720 RepID=UPI0015762B36|nr:hypothetical protein [Rhodoferax sp. BAB1]QKO20795.1 hypothetical protein HTY51_02320 [Rhodoferax sp. BAB1]